MHAVIFYSAACSTRGTALKMVTPAIANVCHSDYSIVGFTHRVFPVGSQARPLTGLATEKPPKTRRFFCDLHLCRQRRPVRCIRGCYGGHAPLQTSVAALPPCSFILCRQCKGNRPRLQVGAAKQPSPLQGLTVFLRPAFSRRATARRQTP